MELSERVNIILRYSLSVSIRSFKRICYSFYCAVRTLTTTEVHRHHPLDQHVIRSKGDNVDKITPLTCINRKSHSLKYMM